MDSLDTMDRGWNGVCGFLDNPGISIVSKESIDTPPVRGLLCVCGSLDNPRISIVSYGVHRHSDRGLLGVCGFLDNPGISIVSKESIDTLTEGCLVYVNPWTIPGSP